MVHLAIGGLGCGGVVDEERIPGETGVPLAALGIEDPEGRPPSRRSVSVVGDVHLRALTDDVASQADPRSTGQLQADAGRLVHRGGESAARDGAIEDQEQGLRPAGEGRQPMEPVGDLCRRVRPGEPATGQVQDQQVHGPTGQQRAGDTQTLVQALRGDDHEPVQQDPATHRLHRVQAARQVQPGDDGSTRLGLRDRPQGEGGPTARAVPADGDAGRCRETTRSHDGVQRCEPGADDPVTGERRGRRCGSGVTWLVHHRHGRQGECPERPRSCRSPASLEARDGGVHIGARGRHRTPIVEQMFYQDKAQDGA